MFGAKGAGKFFLHHKSPYLVDPPPHQQRSQCKVNRKQYIWGKIRVHKKTVSVPGSPFPQRHAVQCEQPTHPVNMTRRNTQYIGAEGPKEKFVRVTWP